MFNARLQDRTPVKERTAHNDDAQMSILRAAAKLLPPPMGSLSNGREVHRIGGISAAVITTLQ